MTIHNDNLTQSTKCAPWRFLSGCTVNTSVDPSFLSRLYLSLSAVLFLFLSPCISQSLLTILFCSGSTALSMLTSTEDLNKMIAQNQPSVYGCKRLRLYHVINHFQTFLQLINSMDSRKTTVASKTLKPSVEILTIILLPLMSTTYRSLQRLRWEKFRSYLFIQHWWQNDMSPYICFAKMH